MMMLEHTVSCVGECVVLPAVMLLDLMKLKLAGFISSVIVAALDSRQLPFLGA